MWLDLPALESNLSTNFVGRRVIYMTSTGSTMDVARMEAESGADEGSVIIAEEQSAGRGRFGRSWVSPAGKNLYFTLILRPSSAALRLLSVIAPLALCRAIETRTGLRPAIKWPNDVLIGGRKAAGILIESGLSGASPRFALVGIGLNVNFNIAADSEIAPIATSISMELKREVSREELMASILNEFEVLLADEGGVVHAAWKKRLETLGRRVTLSFREQTCEGVAEDVDMDGNLLLRTDDGSLMTIEAGEVTLRPPAPSG